MVTFRQQPLKLRRTIYLPLCEMTGLPRFLSNGCILFERSCFISRQVCHAGLTYLVMAALGASNACAQAGDHGAICRRVLNEID
jgi:hypothetical protein